jgi:hypothetical protein
MSASNSPWRLVGERAVLTAGELAATIDLGEFDLGLQSVNWAGSLIEGRVLGPQLPRVSGAQPPITECYIRGSDLVTSFERPGPLAAVPHVYWRVRHGNAARAVGIELIVSMRTDLLDSEPQTHVVTELSHATIRYEPFRMLDLPGGVSFFQIVHPDDLFAVEERRIGDRYRIRATLFPERLEKGVIRRARICGWFLPSDSDLAVAVELAREFIAEPPPLTT